MSLALRSNSKYLARVGIDLLLAIRCLPFANSQAGCYKDVYEWVLRSSSDNNFKPIVNGVWPLVFARTLEFQSRDTSWVYPVTRVGRNPRSSGFG